MKIVYVVSNLRSTGALNILISTIKYLDRNVYTPVILTLSPDFEDSQINYVKEMNVEIISLNQSRLKGLLFAPGKLKKYINKLKPDIIQANCFRSIVLVGMFIKQYKIIAVIHNFPYEDYIMKFGKMKGFIMHLLVKVSLKKFDRLISVSESLQKRMAVEYDLESEAIKNGIDTNILSMYKTDREQTRYDLKIDNDKKVFIFLDSLIRRKDPETTIRAFLKAFGSNNVLIIAGGGELEDFLKNKYKEHKNIIFLGRTGEPFKYLKASDFYVSTSLSESFHLSVVEAIYAGLFSVVSDIAPHREILSLDPSLGVVFEPQNVDKLSDALKSVISIKYEPDIYKAIVENNLNAQLMSENYQKIYVKTISGNK